MKIWKIYLGFGISTIEKAGQLVLGDGWNSNPRKLLELWQRTFGDIKDNKSKTIKTGTSE
jgi:hypothetical protein